MRFNKEKYVFKSQTVSLIFKQFTTKQNIKK